MLRSLKDLENYTVCAADGKIGKADDFLIDDERWMIRYLVIETGGLLDRKQVLITPSSVVEVEWSTSRFQLALTKDTVKNSPDADTRKPLSRQRERELYSYYGYPPYWNSTDTSTVSGSPALLVAQASLDPPPAATQERSVDVHLRSARELRGYTIQATDGSIGHVDDFIVEDDIWGVRYLVIDTSNWWLGKKVLVAPEWAGRIDWLEQVVFVEMTREAVKASPEWDPSVAVDRDYEMRLYQHYGRVSYWSGAAVEPRSRKRTEEMDDPLIERQKHQHE